MSRWLREARVCAQLDPSLPERYETLGFDELKRISLARQEGALQADALAKDLPTGPGGIDLVLRMHALIFREEPALAGRFRVSGERVFFGGDGKHRREGLQAERIEGRLTELLAWFSRSQRPSQTKPELASRCADFLESFLMIHPFVDGNGRVGRLVLVAAARGGTPWEFDWRGAGQGDSGRASRISTSNRRRSYIQALQFAHQHSPQNGDPHRRPSVRTPCAPLARWLTAHLEDSGADLVDEPPVSSEG